jgi:hypothetical protein
MTESDESERALGRAVAIGLPVAGGASALVVGLTASFGSALLVLAATALLSTIGLVWASLRTLSGDAPLPLAVESLDRRRGVDALSQKKRQVLRALKDLENERALGKIDAADYAQIAARYREEAKSVMREMEAEVAPARERAEAIARDYLKGRGLDTPLPPPAAKAEAKVARRPEGRMTCPGCGASNEPDATFCKGCGARLNDSARERSDAKT